MALPINVKELINRRVVESARVEYKRDWNPLPILHTICAFANDIDNWGGGYIVIGVEEESGMPKLPVIGLNKRSIDKINKELLQLCNLIEPRYIPVVEEATYEDSTVLVVWAPGGNARPYKCPISLSTKKADRVEKGYYVRKISNTIRANALEEKELFMLSNNSPFDDRPNLKANLEDMRRGLISEFLYSVRSDLYSTSLNRSLLEIATDMRLVGGPTELRKPINVGLMFFNEHPDTFFEYARIEVVDKPDPTGLGMTEKVFFGPLDRQLRDALSYIQNYIIKERVFKESKKAEAKRIYNYPYAAIEEALSNAIYHKSYQIGEPITVTVTPEKMEITSLPGPDRTISSEDIANRRLVSRRYRNRRIGDFLKELKLVEGRNTGIPTILRAMEHNGSGLPIFETNEDRTYFTVILPVHETFLTEKMVSRPEKADSVKKKTRRNPEDIKELILKTLEKCKSMSATALAEALGYKRVNGTLSKIIHDLVDEQVLVYTHPESLKNRNQKLRLAK